jgi:hypothetical protein
VLVKHLPQVCVSQFARWEELVGDVRFASPDLIPMIVSLLHLEEISGHGTSERLASWHLKDVLLVLRRVNCVLVPDVHVDILSSRERRHEHLRSLVNHIILEGEALQ